MIKRAIILTAACAALSACQPAVPDSGQGVGFEDSFVTESQARDAALTGTAVPAPTAVTAAPLSATVPPDGSAAATAAETSRVLAATRPSATPTTTASATTTAAVANSGVTPVVASPTNPAPAVVNSAGISDENNFDAVAGQRTIDDDAARIAANKSQYQVVEPEALPERADSGPNIVAYALSTSHAPGTNVYRRIGLASASKLQRVCSEYPSADQAQIDFLARGGPARDRKGMDPDGDGYACDWDPTPFRRAAQQG